MANATIAFSEAVRSNHQLFSKVGGVFAKLLCTRMDGYELFKHCLCMSCVCHVWCLPMQRFATCDSINRPS